MNEPTLLERIQHARRRVKESGVMSAPQPPQPRKYDDDEDYVSPGVDGLLAASETLLAVNRGLRPPDERDAQGFKRIYTTPKLLRERVSLDPARSRRKLLAMAARRRTLKGWSPFALDDHMLGHIIGNPLSSPLEEINPLHILEQSRRVTQMGPGGIGSDNAITEGMQMVHPSQFGFVSPLEGPECHTGETEVATDQGFERWTDVFVRAEAGEDVRFLCLIDGRQSFEIPERVMRHAYSGEMLRFNTEAGGLDVTPNHRIWFSTPEHPEVRCLAPAEECRQQGMWLMGAHPSPTAQPKFWVSDVAAYEMQDGFVYCATVPGGFLLTRRTPAECAVWSGNSERIGVDARLAWGVKIGSDGNTYQKFRDRRTGKFRWLSPRDLDGKVVRLPD